MFATLQHRPIIIAERHNCTRVTYQFYLFLKNNPQNHYNFCLFEGAETTDTHIQSITDAFKEYQKFISCFLNTKDPKKIYNFLQQDLANENLNLSNFIADTFHIDIKKFPYGLGHIRNLSVHFLLYQHLKPQKTQWISIDSFRQNIKNFAAEKVSNNTAYLYKTQRFVGDISTQKQKIILEAATIRSKLMADNILKYAYQGTAFCLLGNRHGFDIASFTPDLADIFGYHPQDNHDKNLYYYRCHHQDIEYIALQNFQNLTQYCRQTSDFNTKKIKSNFGLKQDYLFFLEKLTLGNS